MLMRCTVVLKTQFIKIINLIFRKNFEKLCEFSLKMFIFCNVYLVDKINNGYCRKFEEKFQLTRPTPYWSMISRLLHLVGLRPRVYYTLTNFRGGQGPLAPPPQYANVGRRPCRLIPIVQQGCVLSYTQLFFSEFNHA